MSGASASFHLDDAEAKRMFQRIREWGANARPVLNEIGSILEDSSRKRFETERAPDGTPWAPLSEKYKAWKAKKGLMTGILKARRGDLAVSPKWDPPAADSVTVTAYDRRAVFHQFGTRRGIPARPFLGVSEEDREDIMDAVRRFMQRAAAG